MNYIIYRTFSKQGYINNMVRNFVNQTAQELQVETNHREALSSMKKKVKKQLQSDAAQTI